MKLAALLMGVLLLSSSSFAADAENTDTTTVDHSKNILTGSHTKKVKRHVKKKNVDGADVDATTTDTTTVKKDGTVKHDSDLKVKKEEDKH